MYRKTIDFDAHWAVHWSRRVPVHSAERGYIAISLQCKTKLTKPTDVKLTAPLDKIFHKLMSHRLTSMPFI